MQEQNLEFYTDGIFSGNRRVIAKTITLVESTLPSDRRLALRIIEQVIPYSGKSVRFGITGVPGVGKSTFIENLGLYLAGQGNRVAVLAVDPTSRRSGGSILGDKTRMEKLAAHENTFIRPSPAGDTLGGVAAKTREIMLICEAAGYDVVMVETVGVGQSETRVSTMVDFFLALLIAGAGDELQGIKRGILEVADAVAINKADGDNLERAERARKEYETALHLVMPSSRSWTPPVLTCSSVTEGGTADVWDTVQDHRRIMEDTGEFGQRRRQQALDWMWTMVEDGLKQRLYENETVKRKIPKISEQVEKELISPSAAAEEILSYI